jgi:hypothetical protein
MKWAADKHGNAGHTWQAGKEFQQKIYDWLLHLYNQNLVETTSVSCRITFKFQSSCSLNTILEMSAVFTKQARKSCYGQGKSQTEK